MEEAIDVRTQMNGTLLYTVWPHLTDDCPHVVKRHGETHYSTMCRLESDHPRYCVVMPPNGGYPSYVYKASGRPEAFKNYYGKQTGYGYQVVGSKKYLVKVPNRPFEYIECQNKRIAGIASYILFELQLAAKYESEGERFAIHAGVTVVKFLENMAHRITHLSRRMLISAIRLHAAGFGEPHNIDNMSVWESKGTLIVYNWETKNWSLGWKTRKFITPELYNGRLPEAKWMPVSCNTLDDLFTHYQLKHGVVRKDYVSKWYYKYGVKPFEDGHLPYADLWCPSNGVF